LLLAVEKQNIPLIKILLAHEVQCNFRESDPPRDKQPHDHQGCRQVADEGLDYTPPLVRAVQHGNVKITRLLIAHGADLSAQYHGLKPDFDQNLSFVCGRVLQLAME
jgi:hypothetical protein